MKYRLLFAFLLTLTPMTIVSAAPKKSQQTTRQSVMDYFKLLPANMGFFETSNRKELLKKGASPVVDLKNDYFQATGDGAQPSLEIAVFRYRGRDTIAVTTDSRVGDFSFRLLRYENRKWREVTEDLSPMVSKDDLHYVIPRYGTTIKVFKSNGTHLANLYWEKGQFSAESFDPTGHR